MLAYRLTLDDKFKLCRSIAEECIQESELRNLLDKKPNIVAYDGFEPSGRMHIAQVRAAQETGGLPQGPACCLGTCWKLRPKLACQCLQGVLKALNVNKLTRCGVTFKFW